MFGFGATANKVTNVRCAIPKSAFQLSDGGTYCGWEPTEDSRRHAHWRGGALHVPNLSRSAAGRGEAATAKNLQSCPIGGDPEFSSA